MSKRTRLLSKLKYVYSHNTKLVLDVSNDDIGLIIEALEKQKEKKVIDITPFFSDTGVYRCPKCKDIYTFKQGKPNYCSECGQKLDWSEADE
jgi:uncharacterized Zn ribbon protein